MPSIPFMSAKPVVPVIRLEGAIGPKDRFNPSLNLAGIGEALKKAFEMKNAQAVALLVNSPGGRPAQSKLIHDQIRYLAKKHDKKTLVFCEDLAASGGYMIACAGDVIYCDSCSILGSIGVIGASFGFARLIEKIGIERRVYTAGNRKSILDPFSEEKEEDVAKMREVQTDLHEIFIEMVKSRRAGKLNESNFETLFSGEFWVGQRTVELGLADEIGHLSEVCAKLYGPDIKLVPIKTEKRGFVEKFLSASVDGVAEKHGDAVVKNMLSGLETRSMTDRYGI